MEEHIPPPNSDPEFRSELTRTGGSNPASSSFVALRTCAHATPGTSTEWTNEKHRSYINSLETSFVNKLYHSRHLRDCHPQKYVQGTHPSEELPFKTYNSSEQVRESNLFIVVRDRRSQKIISPRNETLLESTADSNVTMERPRMDHIVSCYKGTHLRRKPTSEHSGVIARTSEQNPACHQDSVDSAAEISGQNFVDEDNRGKLNCEFIPKRLKRASPNSSSNDQLVPLGNFDTKEVSMAHNAPSGREEQGHHQLLLEHRESFICPKSIFTDS
ncbi:cold-regulated protein 28-like [Rosa sericea]